MIRFIKPVLLSATVILLASFTLSAPLITDNGVIPMDYTCSGYNHSPELTWKDAPRKTKSFALTAIDTTRDVVHWVIYNIPAEVMRLDENIGHSEKLSNGAMQGRNYLRNAGYDGPCPPAGQTHSYTFTLYALDSMLELQPNASNQDLQKAMKGHVLGKAQVQGTFTSDKKKGPNPYIRPASESK